MEEQDKQIEKLREQNRKNELRNELLRTKKQDMLGEIAELKERQNEREKLRQEREKMQQEIAELKKQKQCKKLDNTMDYCITRRGHKGEDIDSDWVCIGTTYLLKKIDKCE